MTPIHNFSRSIWQWWKRIRACYSFVFEGENLFIYIYIIYDKTKIRKWAQQKNPNNKLTKVTVP